MNIKLIALDVDGTLVDSSHIYISERNKLALRRCTEQGIEIVLASGRPMALIEPVAKELGYVKYAISANGSAVWDRHSHERIVSREISPDIAEKILSVVLKYPIALEVYCEGRAWVDHNWTVERFEKMPQQFLQMRNEYNRHCNDLYKEVSGKTVEKFNVDGMPRVMFDEIMEQLQPIRDELAIQYIECYGNMEINNRLATKGEVLKGLCTLLGIESFEVMAFGDSENDVSMLKYAGESYAMENGEQAALESAKHIAKKNTEDGIAEVIEKYLLQS